MSLPQDAGGRVFRFAIEVIDLYEKLQRQGGAPQLLGRQLLRCVVALGVYVEYDRMTHAAQEAREAQYLLRLIKPFSVAVTERIERESAEVIALLSANE